MKPVLKNYLMDLLKFSGAKAPIFIFVLTLGSLIQGVGIIMLIPMLNVWLNTESTSASPAVYRCVANTFSFFNLPMTLSVILIIYCLLITLQSSLKRLETILSIKIVQGFSRYQYDKIYKAVSHAQWLFFIRNRDSDITHVMTSEIQKVVSGTHILLLLISSLITAIVHLALAFSISTPMTTAGLVCGGILLVLQLPKNKTSYQTGKSVIANRRKLYFEITEHLSGMKLAKSYGAEQSHIDSFNTLVSEIEQQKVGFTKTKASMTFMYEVGFVIAISSIFYSSITFLHMQVTELFLMVYIFSRLLPIFSRLHQYNLNILNMLPSFHEVTNLYERCTVFKDNLINSAKALSWTRGITLNNISFSYETTPALKDINITIQPSSITAIIGVSGAGKTTLADILMGLLPPDSGELIIDGKSVYENMISWRNSIGYVPQDTFLFHDSIRENLKWAKPDASDSEIELALSDANADSLIAMLPKGLDTVVGDRGEKLSGGERQRIALARALLRKPSLLLLDEATNCLDKANEQSILKTIKKLSQKLTVIIISHKLSTLEFADMIVLLENGKVTKQTEYSKSFDFSIIKHIANSV